MKDRLSIHLENGQSEVREAVTVLRNGGTASQSGLVGITNAAYDAETGSPYIPETIINIQSTGDSNVRFSSGPSKDYRSSLELLGVGNTRASGLHFCYDPQFDDSYIDADSGYGTYEPCVNPNGTDKTVADFSLIRPSGQEGMEFSHISLSERGYVSIGLTRVHEQRHFEANAPLTIAYMCDDHQDSGTISIHEQASAPTTHTNFGKVYDYCRINCDFLILRQFWIAPQQIVAPSNSLQSLEFHQHSFSGIPPVFRWIFFPENRAW